MKRIRGGLRWGFLAAFGFAVGMGTLLAQSGNLPGGGGVSLSAANNWTALQTFSGSIAISGADQFINLQNGVIRNNAIQTPDTLTIETTPASNSIHIIENADAGFDFAFPQVTDPSLVLHSHNQSTNQYAWLYHDGTDFNIAISNNGYVIMSNTVTGANGASTAFGSKTAGGVYWATQNTPDADQLYGPAVSNYWIMAMSGDVGTDFNHPQTTHPWFFYQSATETVTTQYNAIGAVGLRTELFKTLTESSATSVVRLPVASGSAISGTFEYAIYAADATDQEIRHSIIKYSVANKAGTETCALTVMTTSTPDASITEVEDLNDPVLTAGTLTYAITCDTTPANAVDIQINAVSSLTQTTLQARYQVHHFGPSEPLPQ